MAVFDLTIALQLVLAAFGVQHTEIALPLASGADPYGPAVERMVGAIIEYSRWPEDKPVVRLCMVGPSDHADNVTSRRFRSGQELRVSQLPANAGAAGCDAVFLGRLSLEEQRRITDGLRGRPVLSIAENDPACQSRAMICLLFESNGLSFRLNIDSISRSRVRIDPRVLRMGRPEEG